MKVAHQNRHTVLALSSDNLRYMRYTAVFRVSIDETKN